MGAGAGAESVGEKMDSTVIWTLSGQSIKSVSFAYSLDQDLWNWENALAWPSSVAWQRISLSFPAGAKGPSFEHRGQEGGGQS